MTDQDQFEGVKNAARLRSEEATLTKIIRAKMTAQECLREQDREALAYRISEIFVAAKGTLHQRATPHDSRTRRGGNSGYVQ